MAAMLTNEVLEKAGILFLLPLGLFISSAYILYHVVLSAVLSAIE